MTPTRVPPVVEVTRPDDTVASDGDSISPLLLVGGGLLTLLVGGYIMLFTVRTAALERYSEGFVLERCPICHKGHLGIEERVDRVLGIPRVRRTVQCDNCRSLLREVGTRRWRYAVDRNANPQRYAEYNNSILRETELLGLEQDLNDDPDAPSYIE